mmetsp:Transcript_52689/g.138555  ORF Transcript_52689/g.138555 Transcript_52689/m.138555 type:complete len:305 (-) Transcript_52689:1125-2039(-)
MHDKEVQRKGWRNYKIRQFLYQSFVAPVLRDEAIAIIAKNLETGSERFARLSPLQKEWHAVYERVDTLSKPAAGTESTSSLAKPNLKLKSSQNPSNSFFRDPNKSKEQIQKASQLSGTHAREQAVAAVLERRREEKHGVPAATPERDAAASASDGSSVSPCESQSGQTSKRSLQNAMDTEERANKTTKWNQPKRDESELACQTEALTNFLQTWESQKQETRQLDTELKLAQLRQLSHSNVDTRSEEDIIIERMEKISALHDKAKSEQARERYQQTLYSYQDELDALIARYSVLISRCIFINSVL